MCAPKEVDNLVVTKSPDQVASAAEWFTRAALAVRQVIDETPGGAFVVHRSDLEALISDEDSSVVDFSPLRMRGILLALRPRVGLRAAAYRSENPDVLVIYDPARVSLKRAMETAPTKAYAPQVKAALA